MKAALAMLVAIGAAPTMAAAASPFDGIPGLTFEYYDVTGRTAAEIYASMRARAAKSGENGLGFARTAWQSETTWRELRSAGRCSVSDASAIMRIKILLPRLVTRDGVTREGWAYWRSSIAGLEIHEAGHARIAWDHRDDFRKAASGARCSSIKQVANAVQDRIGALQEDYDRDTRHGQTQMPPIER